MVLAGEVHPLLNWLPGLIPLVTPLSPELQGVSIFWVKKSVEVKMKVFGSGKKKSVVVFAGEAGESSLEGYIVLLNELLQALEGGGRAVNVPDFRKYHQEFLKAYSEDV